MVFLLLQCIIDILITKTLRWKLSINYLKDLANKGFKLHEKDSFPIKFNQDDSLLNDYIGLFGLNTLFLVKQFCRYYVEKDYHIRERNNDGELDRLTLEEKQEFYGDQTSYRAFLLHFYDDPQEREAIRNSKSFLGIILIIVKKLAIEKIDKIKERLFPTTEKPSSTLESTSCPDLCKGYLAHNGQKVFGISNIDYKSFKIRKFSLHKQEERQKYYQRSNELVNLRMQRKVLEELLNNQSKSETPSQKNI